MKRMRIFLTLALPLLLAGGAWLPAAQGLDTAGQAAEGSVDASIWFVDWEAAGANDGTSWQDAFTDLQSALDAAVAGDKIAVAAGTYHPTAEHGGSGDRFRSFGMKNRVGLYGGFDPSVGDIGWDDRDWANNVTTLSGDLGTPGDPADNCYHVLYHPEGTGLNARAVLDGFVVAGGKADGSPPHNSGGGMYNYLSSPTLANCTFTGNSAAGSGGAMSNNYSSPTLANCIFTGNSAPTGGGLYNPGSSPTLTNCILWGDTSDEIYGTATVTYSDVQGGYVGAGNIDTDPEWVEPANRDYHLQGCSPAVDVGSNAAPDLPAYDFEGDDRIINGTVDMGVDEADYPPPATATLTVSSGGGGSVTEPGEGVFAYPCGQSVGLVATPEAGFRFATWTGDAVDDPTSPETFIVMAGDRSVTAMFSSGLLFVDLEAAGANDGTSWQDAFTDLQSALDLALPGDDIWVAAGTYYPSVEVGGSGDRFRTFQMRNQVGVYGGFDPSVGDIGWDDRDWLNNVTTLSGDIGTPDDAADNCYHVFYHPVGTGLDASAVLDGFVVTAGNAYGSGPHNSGGAIYNSLSSPTLANCTFTGNTAALYGGGVYNESSSPTLANCTFTGNSASQGGGMYNSSSSPTLTNGTFTGNSAASGGGMNNLGSSPTLANCRFESNGAYPGNGGGMYNYISSPTLASCTFTGNSAYEWGGGMSNYQGSSPTLSTCAFLGNSAFYGGGMDNTNSSSPALTNCVFTGNSDFHDSGAMSNWYGSQPTLTNCILYGERDKIDGSAIVTYSDTCAELDYPEFCWWTYPGEGNIAADPLWVAPYNGDFHLSAASPCIDAGTNDAPNLPPYDFEGDPRIFDCNGDGIATVDMGIDEVVPTMHVGGMSLTKAGAGPWRLTARGYVHDAVHAALPGVQVTGQWRLPNGAKTYRQFTTTAQGGFQFQLNTSAAGQYRFCVVKLVKAGYIYATADDHPSPPCRLVTLP